MATRSLAPIDLHIGTADALTADVGFAIAFGAGLASFLSPCVLPLIPSYITFITGMTLDDVPRARRVALVHALLFVLGFSLIFLALGASATLIGRLLVTYRVWISRVGGLLVLAFGLYLLGVFNLGAFSRERRIHITDKPLGYLGTVVVGHRVRRRMDAMHRPDPRRAF